MQTAPTSIFSSPDSAARSNFDFNLPARSELSEIFRNYKMIFENAADHLLAIPREEFQRPPLRRE